MQRKTEVNGYVTISGVNGCIIHCICSCDYACGSSVVYCSSSSSSRGLNVATLVVVRSVLLFVAVVARTIVCIHVDNDNSVVFVLVLNV